MTALIKSDHGPWRHYVLLALALGSLAFILSQAPIPQDLAYHEFCDTRRLFGIPNFYNVISNLPFLMVGIAGIVICRYRSIGPCKAAWMIFFAGITLVAIGSAYYHLSPSNSRLLWDRLPMTLGFMGLFAALLGEHIDRSLARFLLLPLMLTGICSVLFWYQYDDLRLYVWVQFMPMLVIPALLCLYRSSYSHSRFVALALLAYVLAKLLEAYDAQIFSFLGMQVSGHSLKHLMAAVGSASILWMLRLRTHSQT